MVFLIALPITLVIAFLLYILFCFLWFKKSFTPLKSEIKIENRLHKILEATGNSSVKEKIMQCQANIAELKYEEAETVGYDGAILFGKLFISQKENSKTVLLCHGFNITGEIDFCSEFEFYRNLNYNILLIDQRAHGKSFGIISTLGIAESYDIATWCRWIEIRFGTQNGIIIHGKAMGAFAALAAGSAIALPKNVEGIIADSLFNSVYSKFRKDCETSLAFLAKPTLFFCNKFYDRYCGYDMRDVNLFKIIESLRLPVLFIHGGKDAFMTKEEVLKIAQQVNSKSEILIVENADRGMCFLTDSILCGNAVKNFSEK